MKVTVQYTAQAKRAVGTATESLDVEPDCTVQDLVRRVAEHHGDSLAGMLFAGQEQLHPSILLFLGDDQVRWDTPVPLRDDDVVTILSPISGG